MKSRLIALAALVPLFSCLLAVQQASAAPSCQLAPGVASTTFATACDAASSLVSAEGATSLSAQLTTLIQSSVRLVDATNAVNESCLSVSGNCTTAASAQAKAVAFATNALQAAADCSHNVTDACTKSLTASLDTIQQGGNRAASVAFPCVPIFNTCSRHEDLSASGGPFQCCGGACDMYIQYDDHLSIGFTDYLVYAATDVEVDGQSESYIICETNPTLSAETYTMTDNFDFGGAKFTVSGSASGPGVGIQTTVVSQPLVTTAPNQYGLVANYTVKSHGAIWKYTHTTTGEVTIVNESWSHSIDNDKYL